jgi:threonine aldolase
MLASTPRSAANAGVQFTAIGTEGLFTAAEFLTAVKPAGHMMFPPTSLVAIENTHNRCGGLVFPEGDAAAICRAARELGIRTYLDGARLFNAAAASGRSVAQLAAPFDAVSVALSKGLGCPVGSVIAGAKADMAREAFASGGCWVGPCARPASYRCRGLYALDHNLTRLPTRSRQRQAHRDRLRRIAPRSARPDKTVQTNIVIFHMAEDAPDAASIAVRAKEAGVLVSVFGQRKLRAVTHLDVDENACARAADILAGVIERS